MNYLTFFLVLVFNFTSYSNSQLQYIPIHEKDSLGLDKSIRYGCLNNGLTYYIKSIKQPSSKIHLNLYVNVGDFDEEDNQWQLAHTIEHLAFRESVNFPKEGGIQDPILLNKLGMTDRDISGITLNHVTTYKFNAPAKNSIAIDKGLHWFKDIINGKLKLLNYAIENERGIVSQELAVGISNAETYFADVSLRAKLFPGIQEVHDLDLLNTFKPRDLRRFYHDWYRPDLAAISVVGNISNMDDLEIQIKKLFSEIKMEEDTKKPIDHKAVYLNQPKRFGMVEHKGYSIEKGYSPIETILYFRDAMAKDPHHSLNEGQREILRKLYERIIQTRFIKTTQVYNSFFNVKARYMGKANFPTFKVTIISENNKEEEALKEVMKILGQVQRDGVLPEEWMKIRAEQLENFNKKEHDISYWERGIRDNFVHGTDFSVNMEVYLSKWLSELSLTEFNSFIQETHGEEPEDIGIIAPKGHPILSSILFEGGKKVDIKNPLSYKEKQIRSWIKDALDNIPNESYCVQEIPKNLMNKENTEKLELKGYIKKGTDNYGAEKYQLDNGIKVILKSFKPSMGVVRKGDIIIWGFSSKGALCYPKGDYFTAINAANIVKNSGVGEVDKFQLKNFLSSTDSSIRFESIYPYISDLETGIRGDTHLEDLETMLQLVYLYFNQPRMNEKAYKDWKSNELKQMVLKTAQKSEFDFRYEVKNIIGDSTGFDELPGLGKKYNKGTHYYEGVNESQMNRAYDIYRELFGNARDFTFIFSGDFPKDSVLTLIRKYLGNLPNLSVISCKDVSMQVSKLPEGPLYEEIEMEGASINRGFYNLKFLKQANTNRDWKKQVKVAFLGYLTSVKLNSLRDKGLPLYYFGAVGKLRNDFLQYEVDMFLRTDPEYFSILREECHKIITEIKNGEIRENEFKEAHKRLNRFYNEENLNQNFVKSYLLYEHYNYGIPLIRPSVLQQFAESLTLKDVKNTALELFKKGNQFEFSTK